MSTKTNVRIFTVSEIKAKVDAGTLTQAAADAALRNGRVKPDGSLSVFREGTGYYSTDAGTTWTRCSDNAETSAEFAAECVKQWDEENPAVSDDDLLAELDDLDRMEEEFHSEDAPALRPVPTGRAVRRESVVREAGNRRVAAVRGRSTPATGRKETRHRVQRSDRSGAQALKENRVASRTSRARPAKQTGIYVQPMSTPRGEFALLMIDDGQQMERFIARINPNHANMVLDLIATDTGLNKFIAMLTEVGDMAAE